MDLFRPREKFLVLEIGPKTATGWFLTVDEDRNIIFERRATRRDLKDFFKFSRSPVENILEKAWEGNHIFKRTRRQVIAAASPDVATTVPIPMEIEREPRVAKSRIMLAEVEGLAAQGMQKIFNGCRSEAAKRLGIHELDTILVGARTERFKVDGRAVKSPVGFKGKHVSFLLELTFTSRSVFQDLRQFFNETEGFAFMESPQTVLRTLARVRKLPLNLIAAGDRETALFVLQEVGEHPVLYREKLDWNFADIFKTITDAFGVSEAIAKELYRRYRGGELSDDAARAFRRLLEPLNEGLVAAVEKGKLQGAIFMDSPHAVPVDLPLKLSRGVAIEEEPVGDLLAELDFSPDVLASRAFARSGDGARRALLYFLAAYFDKTGMTEINQKLRRRLHWLVQ